MLWHYYGGVPMAIVPDNLKSAVTKSSLYEPTLNQAFENFALALQYHHTYQPELINRKTKHWLKEQSK